MTRSEQRWTLARKREGEMLLVLNLMLRLWGAVARDRRDLVLENIALRHQIAVLTRTKRRPALRFGDRLLWTSLSRSWTDWRTHLVIVQPDTSCAGTVLAGSATGAAGLSAVVGHVSIPRSPSRFGG